MRRSAKNIGIRHKRICGKSDVPDDDPAQCVRWTGCYLYLHLRRLGQPLTTTDTDATTLGTHNPLRYLGYVYDHETSLYYLQSRYYNPTIGRFLNADAMVSTGQGILGNNMFAYCSNNPVMYNDSMGLVGVPFRACRTLANDGGGYSYIESQKEEGIGNKKLGHTTVSHGGCGAIATYNALITLKDYKSFDQVLSYYNSDPSKLNFNGHAGISSDSVAQYFRENGYSVVVTDNRDAIDCYSQVADACILLYAYPVTYCFAGIPVNAYGAHFVEYHRSETGYIGYNTSEQNGIYSFIFPSEYGYKGERYYAIGIFIFN